MKKWAKGSVDKYFAPEAKQFIQEAIVQADGNEVFFLGKTDDARMVTEVSVLARGNSFSAPALLQVAASGDVVIHNHPGSDLTPSDADINVASYFGNLNVGFYIVDNIISDVYIVVEAFEKKEYLLLENSQIENVLGQGGQIAHALSQYEYRSEQLEMAFSIVKAFNENLIAVIEAGTGTGKTLAYLVPSLFWAYLNKEKIVVSTNTINLQEQLFEKDIPFLKNCLGFDFKVVILRGRNNYLCKRKLMNFKDELFLVEDTDKAEFIKLCEWGEKTRDGCLSSLSHIPITENWERLQSERENCLRKKCEHYGECFFYKVRRSVLTSNLVIVNHHLLFSDIAGKTPYFKDYNRLIIDEAHNIEDVATSHFEISVTKLGFSRLLSKLYSCSKKYKEKGALFALKEKLLRLYQKEQNNEMMKFGVLLEKLIRHIEDELIIKKESLAKEMMLFFLKVGTYAENSSQKGKSNEAITLKLTKNLAAEEEFIALVADQKEISKKLRIYLGDLKKLKEATVKLPANFSSNEMALGSLIEKISAMLASLEYILSGKADDDVVRWIETTSWKKDKVIRINSSPIDVSDQIRASIFFKFKTIVLTSATLAVNNKFDFFKKRVGLDGIGAERLMQQQIASSFDYKNQVLLAIPLDIAEPGVSNYDNEMLDSILQVLTITQGKAFVLFTSFGFLNYAYSRLQKPLSLLGINILKQGEMGRKYLLEGFKKDKSSVLFGTNSFWEGVDVVGESLECVILTRLPFYVPTDPLVETRVEHIKKKGGNPFMDYIVPQAVIKFKQGFGRLIRNKLDRGAVVVFDKRVSSKHYGKIFLNSLPECNVCKGSREDVYNRLKNFF